MYHNRLESGLAVEIVSERLGHSKSWLRQLEKGDYKSIKIKDLSVLFDIYGVEMPKHKQNDDRAFLMSVIKDNDELCAVLVDIARAIIRSGR